MVTGRAEGADYAWTDTPDATTWTNELYVRYPVGPSFPPQELFPLLCPLLFPLLFCILFFVLALTLSALADSRPVNTAVL